MAQCAGNLEAVNSLLSAQRELEEEIRRRQVECVIERIVEVFAAQGMFAFRWDTMSDPPALPRNDHRGTAYIQ